MSTLGFMLVGFGILTAWSGLEKVYVFDVLREFMGAPSATPKTTAMPASATGGQPPAAQSIPNAPAGSSNPVVHT